jgi:hypothetical protein
MSGRAYRIRASVWGGVTGTRTSYLKANGIEKRYPTAEAAEEEASALNFRMNGPNRTANFRYSVEEVWE